MLAYFLTLIGYLLTFTLIFGLTKNLTVAIIAKILVTCALLFYFRKHFKFRVNFDLLAIAAGLFIAFQWIVLEGYYPLLGEDVIYNYSRIDIFFKLLIGVVIAPVIEEFFTRFFLMRFIIEKNWQKVRIGTYSLTSFIVTIMYFGFSHNRWLVGIITAIILNLLIYRRKNIESCILAHAVANLALGIYVIATGAFFFW
ncbi:MAG: CAAX prenyl protease-related protein [archaeon]